VKSRTTLAFRQALIDLPAPIREAARSAYRQFQQDPAHPSLRFKKVHPKLPIYSARINREYRAVGQLDGDTVIWFWIGGHDQYDRLLSNLS
jgi:hypothetical protein